MDPVDPITLDCVWANGISTCLAEEESMASAAESSLPFRIAHDSTSLAISKPIIKAHGGLISAVNDWLAGATFHFTPPIAGKRST